MDAQKMGAFIAQCRKEKQMTQEQLAQRLQVTDKAVSRWERGAAGSGVGGGGVGADACAEVEKAG